MGFGGRHAARTGVRPRGAAPPRAGWEHWGQRCPLAQVRPVASPRRLEGIGAPDPPLAAHPADRYFRHRSAGSELYPKVLPTLDPLPGRCRLGLVSNGETHPERSGLPGRFAFVVWAQDHGADKPDPRLFAVDRSRAGVGPRQVVHEGGSRPNNVAGARAGGISPCGWIDWAELPTVLDALEAASNADR